MSKIRNLGKPLRMSGPKPMRPGDPGYIDLSELSRQRTERQEMKRDEVLVEMKKRYFGKFDTKLRCNCRKAHIADHATASNPDARPYSGSRSYGRSEDFRRPADHIRDFKVFHTYSCESCGASYKTDVIEGVRKYVPRERRVDEIAWCKQAEATVENA